MKFLTKAVAFAAILGSGTLCADAALFSDLENVYLIGNSTPANWTNTCAAPLTHNADGNWVYEGGLQEGEFKFLTKLGEWTPAIMPFEGGTQVSSKGLANCDIYISENGEPDNKWIVTEAGNYRLTINSKDEVLDIQYLGAFPEVLYALGQSCQHMDSTDPLFMNPDGNGNYVWQGMMTYSDEDKLIKFVLEKGDWDKVTFMVPESVDHNDNVRLVKSGESYKAMKSAETEPGVLKDWFWGIGRGDDGIWKVTANPTDLTVKFERIGGLPGAFDANAVKECYINGLASGCFESNDPGQMTSLGNGKWEWSGTLDYATEDGDANHANKQFKFLTGKGDWNAVWYLVPVGATGDGYIEEIGNGTYPVEACSWIGGRTGVDAFFGLKPGEKGNVKIVVDVPAMQFTISGLPGDDSGVENAAVEDTTIEAIYTVSGARLDTRDINALPKGLYVVKTSAGTMKIAK